MRRSTYPLGILCQEHQLDLSSSTTRYLESERLCIRVSTCIPSPPQNSLDGTPRKALFSQSTEVPFVIATNRCFGKNECSISEKKQRGKSTFHFSFQPPNCTPKGTSTDHPEPSTALLGANDWNPRELRKPSENHGGLPMFLPVVGLRVFALKWVAPDLPNEQ